MKGFLFQSELFLNFPLERVFNFFADAGNLERITPPWLKFELVTDHPVQMAPGALIDYRIRVHGFPIRWRTKIERWEPPHLFVDVQLRGPYRFWEHTHTFLERDGGTLCRDHVRYRPIGGVIVDWLFVRRDIREIFDFRRKKLLEIFEKDSGKGKSAPSAG